MREGWHRYRPRDKCCVCFHGGSSAHPSGCAYKGDIKEPEVVLCLRVEEGCNKHARDGLGFVHILKDQPRQYRPAPSPPGPIINPRMAEITAEARQQILLSEVESLADSLGVSAKSLIHLGIGWISEYLDAATGEVVDTHGTYSFPMRQAGNLVVGIRLRTRDGRKFSVRGSANGLFIPRGMSPSGTLYVVEGPTDTAAALDLGLTAIGRPSNTAGAAFIVEFCKRFLPRRRVTIIHDNDPAGSTASLHTIAGAETLASALLEQQAASGVTIVAPPVKDLRAWVQQGATRRDVEELKSCDV